MTDQEALARLERLGTAQNRKVYGRHGVKGKMFGVSYANLGKLARRIRTDHPLAVRLWKSRNHDARVLATMIADPALLRAADLDAWVRDLDNYVISDAFSNLAARSPRARPRLERWMKSKEEWIGATGWNVLARLAVNDPEIDEDFLSRQLATIEKQIHGRKNRTRYSMNSALIAIGIRSKALEKKALASARRIGPVEVDHGETGCKTPDAVAYIGKVNARRKSRRAGQGTR